MKKLLFAGASALWLLVSCECGEHPKAFSFEFPMIVGDTWFYRELEVVDTNYYMDTVANVGDTVYQGLPAVLLFSTHAKNPAQQETTVAFFRGDTLYHYSRTTGFFPDTVNYNGEIYTCTFDHDHIEIAWMPKALDLGDEWHVATDEGRITRQSDGASYHLSATVSAVFDSVESLSFNDTLAWPGKPNGYGELSYPNCLRVIYTGKLTFEGIPIELTIAKTWWLPGVGPVRQWAYSTNDSTGAFDPLEEYLLDYTGDNQ